MSIALADVVRPAFVALKPLGFRRTGSQLYVESDDNWGVIGFQRSPVSGLVPRDSFTVNLGVVSRRLVAFFSSTRLVAGKLPEVNHHWRERLGFLLDPPRDEWWPLDADLTAIIKLLKERAVPLIRRHMTDEALRDLWLSGQSPGLTYLRSIECLCVLLQALGPTEPLPDLLRQIEAKSPGKADFLRRRLGLI